MTALSKSLGATIVPVLRYRDAPAAIDWLCKVELGGAQTQTTHVVVTDVGTGCAKAQASGAGVAAEIRDEDYGGRGFSCYDLEGHLWRFGSYDPWAARPALCVGPT